MAEKIFLVVFGLLTCLPCIFLIQTRNILHAVFYLLVALLGVAGLFFMVNAEFLGFAQLVLYIGGIVILFLFGHSLSPKDSEGKVFTPIKFKWWGAIFALGIFEILLWFAPIMIEISKIFSTYHSDSKPQNNIQLIGNQLQSEGLISIELIAILLLTLLVSFGWFLKPKKMN